MKLQSLFDVVAIINAGAGTFSVIGTVYSFLIEEPFVEGVFVRTLLHGALFNFAFFCLLTFLLGSFLLHRAKTQRVSLKGARILYIFSALGIFAPFAVIVVASF